ncbi:MAG: hypothetical protein IIA85_02605 [Nanoarchaeota archaeon]|nr:hypothetical protein [Nanoarchaeota archaeon]
MKKVILDTSFILTCVRQKIDFFEYLELQGFQILIPNEVIKELEKIVGSKKKLRVRDDAELALKLLKIDSFVKIDLNSRNVDKGVVKFAKEDPLMVIGTLDSEIKKRAKNPKLVIREKKRLEIV